MTWVPWLDYEGTDDPGSLVIVDTPWRWVLIEAVAVRLCGYRGFGRLGYRLLGWSARRAEEASVEVFRVPFTPEVSERVKQAVEQHEGVAS